MIEKFAYSKAGKILALCIRNCFYPNDRVHWVQDKLAGHKNW